ncbi:PD40 domain-containing protein [Mucilaginibacter sp. SP1R1]|uniref:PD40 domain-containing protein n=1 Tax=Mucilaginibacter sp. SP1R1 TaxID=2723091 RepID=UPI00161AD00C|nr:PD40 domain-containing protein [Mucilaginibacter sp. SP1R1]MBB6149569.1 hypothetical protein [Mucilaginibacter sp. SP1R1]
MNKLFYILLILLLCLSPGLHAQTKLWNSADAYLGQQPPSDIPVIFAQSLLTTADTIAFDRTAFSPDGKQFYYPVNTTWFDSKNLKIKYFTYEDKKWTGPFILNEHYYAPTFSIDGRTLYFLGGQSDGKHALVWQSKKGQWSGGWTAPSVYLQKDYGLYDFMPTKSGTCYVGSNAHQGNRKDYSTYDICQLKMTEKDTTIQSLGAPVNTPGFDGDFYVAPDESYLIVSAKETKDFECELYISFHKPDKSWTPPVSLGPLINDGTAHRWGQYVTPDGKYLFYSKGTSPKDCHIYWVRFDLLLAKLKKENLRNN